MDSTLELIIKNITVITGSLASLCVPIIVICMSNANNRTLKRLEKELEIKYNDKEDLRKQKKLVYAQLSRVLFDVQQLHVSLSGTCVDQNCITEALQKFGKSVDRSHEEISINMLYVSSEVIDRIYGFYNKIGELRTNLAEYNNRSEFDMAHVCVSEYSVILALVIIEIQEIFIKEHPELSSGFDISKQENMINCCGVRPTDELRERYRQSKQRVNSQQ